MEHLRILCFGDSLTEGYTRSGTLFHPYAESLNAYLKKAFPTTELHVDIEGLSGDRVCPPGLFMPRMEAKCKSVLLLLTYGSSVLWNCVLAFIPNNLRSLFKFTFNSAFLNSWLVGAQRQFFQL